MAQTSPGNNKARHSPLNHQLPQACKVIGPNWHAQIDRVSLEPSVSTFSMQLYYFSHMYRSAEKYEQQYVKGDVFHTCA